MCTMPIQSRQEYVNIFYDFKHNFILWWCNLIPVIKLNALSKCTIQLLTHVGNTGSFVELVFLLHVGYVKAKFCCNIPVTSEEMKCNYMRHFIVKAEAVS